MEKESEQIGAALYASPVRHSLSPLIHNTAFKACQLELSYGMKEVDNHNLGDALETLRQSALLGVNLSMPNKIAAISLVDEVTEEAQEIGAINTIQNKNGYLIGHNTDGLGFLKNLAHIGFDHREKSVMILGCGGAALAVSHALINNEINELVIVKRKNETFQEVASKMAEIAEGTRVKTTILPFDHTNDIQVKLQTIDLLINGTNVGMGHNNQNCPLPTSIQLPKNLFVIDMIYEPRETAFLCWAKNQGCQTYNGLGMLVFQAAEAFKLWTGQDMPVNEIFSVLKSL